MIYLATTKKLTQKCLRISSSFVIIFVWTGSSFFRQTLMLRCIFTLKCHQLYILRCNTVLNRYRWLSEMYPCTPRSFKIGITIMLLASFRSSRSEMFFKKGVFKNFAKFTGKHLCQSLFVNKISGLWPATLLKKKLWHKGFPVSFMKFLRTSFFIEHLLVGAYLFLQCMQYQNMTPSTVFHILER